MRRQVEIQQSSLNLQYWLERTLEAAEGEDFKSYKLLRKNFIESYADALSSILDSCQKSRGRT